MRTVIDTDTNKAALRCETDSGNTILTRVGELRPMMPQYILHSAVLRLQTGKELLQLNTQLILSKYLITDFTMTQPVNL